MVVEGDREKGRWPMRLRRDTERSTSTPVPIGRRWGGEEHGGMLQGWGWCKAVADFVKL